MQAGLDAADNGLIRKADRAVPSSFEDVDAA